MGYTAYSTDQSQLRIRSCDVVKKDIYIYIFFFWNGFYLGLGLSIHFCFYFYDLGKTQVFAHIHTHKKLTYTTIQNSNTFIYTKQHMKYYVKHKK